MISSIQLGFLCFLCRKGERGAVESGDFCVRGQEHWRRIKCLFTPGRDGARREKGRPGDILKLPAREAAGSARGLIARDEGAPVGEIGKKAAPWSKGVEMDEMPRRVAPGIVPIAMALACWLRENAKHRSAAQPNRFRRVGREAV